MFMIFMNFQWTYSRLKIHYLKIAEKAKYQQKTPPKNINNNKMYNSREGGDLVYYTGPQCFIITFLIRWLINFGVSYKSLIGWFIKLSVLTF